MSDVLNAPDTSVTPSPNPATEAQGAREVAAKRTAKSVHQQPESFLTKVASDEDYDKVKFGDQFIDPEGNKRTRPWEVKTDDDFASVPEGAQFLDPEGNLREKPRYEGINYTSQTLYNMAVNDKERKKALELGYPGKVKQEGKEFYVDDEGTLRKPRGMTQTGMGLLGGLTSAAAPTLGAIGGEIAGGVAGSAAGPAGAIGGAIGGGAGGAMLGQGFNDAIMALAGVYDRSGGEEATEVGMAGGMGALGSAAGRVIGGAAPYIKDKALTGAPKAAADFLGADEKGLRTAIELREKGVDLVPPSGWAKEAPHLQNVTEVLDPAFRTQQPLKQAAEGHYEKTGSQILSDAGTKASGSLLNPEAKVSSKEAGESLLLKAREELTAADAKLQAAYEARKTTAANAVVGPDRDALRQAEAEARNAAQKVIDAGFRDIEQDVTKAATVSKAGHNGGDLWWGVAEKLKATRTGIVKRAEKMYGEADTLAGGHLPQSEGLPKLAEQFLSEVPPDFKQRYPSIVQKLEALGGKVGENGEVIAEPHTPTFGELHNIRSMLRDGADWYTLSSDVKNGSFKYFAKAVDDVLHDAHAVPELKAAAEQLDKADDFYRENMRVFNARQIKTVMDGLKAGEPADPQQLFNAIVKEGHTDLTKRVMDMVGPNLAAGVRAADVQSMLDNSKSLIPGQIDGMRFVNEVLSRDRSNMLDTIHGREIADKLRKQAQHIAALEGRIDMPVKPGDKALDIIAGARTLAEEAKQAGRTDPLSEIKKETKRIENEMKQARSGMLKSMRGDKLGKILFDPSVGAVEAADQILAKEDLLLAAGARFGEDSPEFNLLRGVYLQRLLQGSMDVSSKLQSSTPEVQQIMLKGATVDQVKTLAKEMDFLLGTKALTSGARGTGASMMAVSRVEHPWGAIPLGKTVGKVVPGADAAGRGMLGKYYKFVTEMMNNLTFLRWVEKGLKGDEAAREMTRQQVQRWAQRGGAVGAGAAEGQFQTPQQPE